MDARPRIGIDLDHEHDGRRWVYKTPAAYADAVVKAGGLPVPIPPGDPRSPRAVLVELDGLLMTGGDDIHPRVVRREASGMPMRLLSVTRERFVLALGRAVLATGTPCLAVCLGCQALNVAAGGDLWLDLDHEHPHPLDHRDGHEHVVRPEPGGALFRYWNGEPQTLKSHHHQAIRRLGTGLALEATTEDGVIEAFRAEAARFVLGVQWHPEVQQDRPGGLRLVGALVEAASSIECNKTHRA